jgi:hypothetical protein
MSSLDKKSNIKNQSYNWLFLSLKISTVSLFRSIRVIFLFFFNHAIQVVQDQATGSKIQSSLSVDNSIILSKS